MHQPRANEFMSNDWSVKEAKSVAAITHMDTRSDKREMTYMIAELLIKLRLYYTH